MPSIVARSDVGDEPERPQPLAGGDRRHPPSEAITLIPADRMQPVLKLLFFFVIFLFLVVPAAFHIATWAAGQGG